MKNSYLRKSKVSSSMFFKILRCFCIDLTVSQISQLSSLSRISISNFVQKIRQRIYKLSLEESLLLAGKIEADESCFGARGEIKVFGLLKREEKVYTQIVDDVSAKTLQRIIRGIVEFKSIIDTDGWKAYDGLVVGYEKHFRVKH